MPKLSWSAFLQRYPAAHLVAGVLPDDEAATSNARPQLNLIAALIARLAPKGLYALTVDRQGRTREIHCVFEKDTDALKVAQAVGASVAGRYPGWASQQTVYPSRCSCSAMPYSGYSGASGDELEGWAIRVVAGVDRHLRN
jgi:hypothetical protein